MTTNTIDFEDLKSMRSRYAWLWCARVASALLLVLNTSLVFYSVYKASTLGGSDATLGLLSSLAGVVVAALLVANKFKNLGWYTVNFLREANRRHEDISGSKSLSKRYRNFKRARQASAELLR